MLEIDDWLINARRSEKHGQRLPDTNKQHPQAGCVRLSARHPPPLLSSIPFVKIMTVKLTTIILFHKAVIHGKIL